VKAIGPRQPGYQSCDQRGFFHHGIALAFGRIRSYLGSAETRLRVLSIVESTLATLNIAPSGASEACTKMWV
jgi:hypothetical protein